MKKFYPSSSAFMIGDTVMTKYDSGCLRSILVKASGIKTGDIHPVYKKVGATHEWRYLVELRQDEKNISIEAEVVTKKKLSEEVMYSGRMDFRVMRDTTEGPVCVIHETKGTVSKNTRRDWRKGEYNLTYLAQLVSYMVDERSTRGMLVCGYYEENDHGALERLEQRRFKVQITDSGRIDVDGQPSGFNVADLLTHRRAVVEILEENKIGPRPDKWNQKWGGPCTRCAFKNTCDKYDELGGDTKGFLESAEEDARLARETPQADPVVNKIKIKKPKGETNVKRKASSSHDNEGPE